MLAVSQLLEKHKPCMRKTKAYLKHLSSSPYQPLLFQPESVNNCCGLLLQAPVVGRLYVCLACARLQLCSACFEGGKHPQHSFACCQAPGAAQEPAERDMQAALLTGLTFRQDTTLAPDPVSWFCLVINALSWILEWIG